MGAGRASSPLVALVAVAIFFAGVVVLNAAGEPPALGGFGQIPPETIVPRTLADGTPVFVRRGDGPPVVLSALSPRGYLLVACPDGPGFIEPGPAFTFDGHGRYVFGGSPHGMLRYDAEERDGNVW